MGSARARPRLATLRRSSVALLPLACSQCVCLLEQRWRWPLNVHRKDAIDPCQCESTGVPRFDVWDPHLRVVVSRRCPGDELIVERRLEEEEDGIGTPMKRIEEVKTVQCDSQLIIRYIPKIE